MCFLLFFFDRRLAICVIVNPYRFNESAAPMLDQMFVDRQSNTILFVRSHFFLLESDQSQKKLHV